MEKLLKSIYLGGHNSTVPLIKDTEIGYKYFLENAGFRICETVNQAEAIVFIEFDDKVASQAPANFPMILIRNEPEIVWPKNFKSKQLKKVRHFIDVGRMNKFDEKFVPWPQNWDQVDSQILPADKRVERVAVINGNRLSFIKGEQYSLRRECIYKISDLDLFGDSWDINLARKIYLLIAELYISLKNTYLPNFPSAKFWFRKPKNYLGSPESKFQTLNKYKYSLVIENSLDYMSEKLFDVLLARTIPIYVGPNIELFDIPKNLVVQVEPNLNAIKEGIDVAKRMDYTAWSMELNTWLSQEKNIQKWSAKNVYENISNQIAVLL